MITSAILLDGGFIKRKLKAALSRTAAAEDIQQLVKAIHAHECLQSTRLHRYYYYDAAPLARTVEHPLDGERIEYGATEVHARNSAMLRQIAQMPYMALRQGEMSHDGWSAKWKALAKPGSYDADTQTVRVRKQDLVPILRQKGVDMRIGMDIAALTLKKQAQIIVLVTSDSDFVPAMKFARREGAQLFLFSLGHGIKEDVIANADLIVPAKVRDLMPESTLGSSVIRQAVGAVDP